MRQLFVIAVLAGMIGVGGCTPWATYPPIEGAVDFNNPALEPIPTLMTRAIRYAAAQDEHEGVITFNLPANTPESVWRKVSERLDGAKPMTEPGRWTYHVTTIRVRTVEAEVDVVRSAPGEVAQLRTIQFKQQFGGWKVISARTWRIRIDAPEPHYPPDSAERSPEADTQPSGDG